MSLKILPNGSRHNGGPRALAHPRPSHAGHVTLGQQMIAEIPFLNGVARDGVAAHHERFDGGGYPLGLRGDQIPLAARIFSVVDSFDAMTNDRPYREALPTQQALGEIRRVAGAQFDPPSSKRSSRSWRSRA